MEVDPSSLLPEFVRTFPSVPIWTDIAMVEDTRVTATGCECGTLLVTTISVDSLDNLQTWEKEFDGPLTSLKLFSVTPPPLTPPACLGFKDKIPESSSSSLHLCVAYSLGETQVFHNILENCLADYSNLPESDSSDLVTSICVADVEMSGQNNIILGTYGQEVLCYQMEDEEDWVLSWTRSLSAPVLSVRCEDVTGDGVRELVVVTTRGVQVLQLQLDSVKEVTIERLRKLVEMKQSKSKNSVITSGQ